MLDVTTHLRPTQTPLGRNTWMVIPLGNVLRPYASGKTLTIWSGPTKSDFNMSSPQTGLMWCCGKNCWRSLLLVSKCWVSSALPFLFVDKSLSRPPKILHGFLGFSIYPLMLLLQLWETSCNMNGT